MTTNGIQSKQPERKTIETPLSNKTLAGGANMADWDYQASVKILPDVNVLKIGGQSFLDRGRTAMFPLVEELAEVCSEHKLLIGTGGGTRARHAYSIALDLDMPTGVLATIGGATSLQNARIVQMLLSVHGGILIDYDRFQELPLFYKMGCIPVMPGMPPFDFWEKPPREGLIPENRTDAGVYLTAEYLGARSCIFIKDEDGLYTDDPKKNKSATFIPEISVQELLEKDLADLVIERSVLEYMLEADLAKEIRIINGLKKGNLTRALRGENVGTRIYVA